MTKKCHPFPIVTFTTIALNHWTTLGYWNEKLTLYYGLSVIIDVNFLRLQLFEKKFLLQQVVGHEPRGVGLGGALTHFIQPLKTRF